MKSFISGPIFRYVLFLAFYYVAGLLVKLILASYHNEKWDQKLTRYFSIVTPYLFRVFLASFLAGIVFEWIPTLLGMLPQSTFLFIFSFLSVFSFAIMVSVIEGFFFISGYRVIGKYQKKEETKEMSKNPAQVMIFFLGFVLIVSVLLDLFLTFFLSYLTSQDFFVKLVKLSCTLKI